MKPPRGADSHFSTEHIFLSGRKYEVIVSVSPPLVGGEHENETRLSKTAAAAVRNARDQLFSSEHISLFGSSYLHVWLCLLDCW